jgi:hypothetical protein
LGDTNGWKRYGIYALFIVFGGILTEASRWLWTHRPVRKNKMFWDTAKTEKELSVILSLRADTRYEKVVTQLDEGKLTLKEAKKRLNEIMSSNGGKQ